MQTWVFFFFFLCSLDSWSFQALPRSLGRLPVELMIVMNRTKSLVSVVAKWREKPIWHNEVGLLPHIYWCHWVDLTFWWSWVLLNQSALPLVDFQNSEVLLPTVELLWRIEDSHKCTYYLFGWKIIPRKLETIRSVLHFLTSKLVSYNWHFIWFFFFVFVFCSCTL